MENRSYILNCALELFASHGYDAVGVQEVAEKARVTKPTLYHYFGSKKGLLEAALNENFVHMEEKIRKAAQYNGDLPLTLHRLVAAYFSFASNHPLFYRMEMSMIYSPPESDSFKVVAPKLQIQLSILEELFSSAVRDHGNMRGRHKAYAISFLGVINAYIQMSFSGAIELNDEITFKAVHQYMHGIYS
ncbi:MAG: TetR/AcrR family transcriptional regulator [Clostridia bacterium]|nr:TetR/AcrR family transcriptional regulator [Clostridia bacterium]